MRGVKRTKESFINDANIQHNNKYDYSKVDFINTMTKVIIICPIHGEFEQLPAEHLKGRGCPKCGKNIHRKTTNDFINNAIKVHGNIYDYSKVNYKNNKSKVIIICPIHGEFEQSPIKHLIDGQGCPKCRKKGNIKTKNVNTISFTDKTNYKDKFIKNAILKHNNKYDYSNVNYKNCNTKVSIICPIHGEFMQSPKHHLEGRGCPYCGRKIVNTETYLELLNKRYDNTKYDFSKVNYINNKTHITIICKEHGEFKILPQIMLQNNVEHCPICQNIKNLYENKLYEAIKLNFNNYEIIRHYHDKKILGRQEIDIYIPELKIGIEYQGDQHFKPINFFGGEEYFNKQLNRDYRKIQKCKKYNINLLHFTFNKKIIPNVKYTVYNDIQYLINIINKHINNG